MWPHSTTLAFGQLLPETALLPTVGNTADSGNTTAYNYLRSVNDDAYYYAGLACGITLMHLDSTRW